MGNRNILVVDDNKDALDHLTEGLNAMEGYSAVGCSRGSEAVESVVQDPRRFQFVVIDHRLSETDYDGIQTARRIADASEDVCILIFSNKITDDPARLRQYHYNAFEAGAHRYMEKQRPEEQFLQVAQFLEEMNQLSRLRDRVRNYYDERRNVPSLLTQLDLGVDIIDRSYKVWFMNEAMHRITGYVGTGLPRGRCSAWHHSNICPCYGCRVHETLETGEPLNRMFLSLMPDRGPGLFFLDVWTQPVNDEYGNVILASDGKPLAVMETVHDLTGSTRLQLMSLDERLSVVARAICERFRSDFTGIRPFHRAAIYAGDAAGAPGTLSLHASAGYQENVSLNAPLDPAGIRDYGAILHRMQNEGTGVFSEEISRPDPLSSELMKKCVYWPILMRGRPVALIRASGPSCGENDVEMIRLYAEQVAVELRSQDTRSGGEQLAETERELDCIDGALQLQPSPETALSFLINEACRLTACYCAHIRARVGEYAELVRLAPPGYDSYERFAPLRRELSQGDSWSSRTILAGTERVVDVGEREDEYRRQLAKLPVDGAKVLERARCFCFEPLILDGRCIGSMGLFSESGESFKPEKRWLLCQIARRAALALHDFLAAQSQKTLQADTVKLLLHNINNPVGTMLNTLKVLREDLEADALSPASVKKSVEVLERQCDRIARVNDGFAALLKAPESRTQRFDLHQMINAIVPALVAAVSGVSLDLTLDPDLRDVYADRETMILTLEVFVQNSIDEFAAVPGMHRLQIALRPGSYEEVKRLGGMTCLAIDVTDDGPGVPPDLRESLFTVIKSSKAKGHGIGLALSRKRVDAARGDVSFDREYRNGAKFTLVMPYTM